MFRLATKKDLPRILAIQKDNLLSKNKETTGGFLVYPVHLERPQKREFITFVSLKNKDITGYFTGFAKNSGKVGNLDLKTIHGKNFYWKHVALSSAAKGSQIIKDFENYCFDQLRKLGFENIIAEICINPLNKKSLGFHTRVQKFKKLSEYTDKNGFTWGIFTRSI